MTARVTLVVPTRWREFEHRVPIRLLAQDWSRVNSTLELVESRCVTPQGTTRCSCALYDLQWEPERR